MPKRNDYSNLGYRSAIVDYCEKEGYSITFFAKEIIGVSPTTLKGNILRIKRLHPSIAKRIEKITKGDIKARWLLVPDSYPPKEEKQ